MKLVGLIIGIFQILIAIWCFDLNNLNQMLVSLILLLSGTSMFFKESESLPKRKAGRTLFYLSFALAVFLILKLLFERLF